MLKIRPINPSDSLIPADWVGGTRQYLERLVQQINACYDNGLYDACAVLCRRLMESLIIEIYVSQKRHADIQQAGFVLQLDALISYLLNDTSVPKSAILRKAAPEVKALGDAAAHDRTYITRQTDIDAIRLSYSRMISELLRLSGIRR